MARPRFAFLWVLKDNLSSLYITFSRQRIRPAFFLAFVIFLIAIVFSFLAFSPVLSPFVYPLF